MPEFVQTLFAPSPERLAIYAGGYQVAWVVAIVLGLVAIVGASRHLRNHRRPLLALLAIAGLIRVIACDFHASEEQWPYITQATCMAFEQARAGYNLCSVYLFGDTHQLGTASLFALGFSLFGGYKAVAGALVLVASLLNVTLVYAVAQRAFAHRTASFVAGLLMAACPAAVFFSGATQTETFNDTFLLGAALLVLWDLQRAARPHPTAQAWAPRLASNPLVRALFVATAVNVRPELLGLLPLLIVSTALSAPSKQRGAMSAVWLALAAVPLLIPTLPGAFLKVYAPTPAATQLSYAARHLVDVYQYMLGPIVGALLVVAFWMGLRKRWTPRREGRVLAWLALGVTALYVLAQGLFDHVMRGQPHVLYHGSVLWWPLLGHAVARGAELAARRPGWPWFEKPARWAALGSAVLLAGFLLAPKSQSFRPGLLNHQLPAHIALVEAIPPGAHVVPLAREVFVDGGIAAALFDDGDYTVHAPNVRGDFDPAAVCRDACSSLPEPKRQGRPIRLVERCEAGPAGKLYPQVLKVCGIEAGDVRVAGGFCVVEVTSACNADFAPLPAKPAPSVRVANNAPCDFNVSPQTAQRVFDATKVSTTKESCKLLGVETRGWHTDVRVQGPTGSALSARIVPVGCNQLGLSGDEFTLMPAGALKAACPKTHAVLVDLVTEEKIGSSVKPTPSKVRQGTVMPLRPRFGIAAVVGLFALLTIGVVRRYRGNSSGWLDVPTAGLAACIGGAFAFVLYVVPSIAQTICFQPMDVRWLLDGLRDPMPWPTGFRALVPFEVRTLFELVGLDASRWLWAICAVHFANGGLMVWLGRELGLSRPYAWIAGLLFFAAPALANALTVEYLLELVAVSAWLTLCAAHLARRRATSPRLRKLWVGVELLAVGLGLGNKESFIVYPLALVGLVLSLHPIVDAKDVKARLLGLVRRPEPHVVLFPLAALVALPQLLSSGGKTAVSLSPILLLEKLAKLVGASAGAGLGAWVPMALGGAALAGFTLYLCVARPRQISLPRAGAWLMLTMCLPMLVLPNRLFPGYLVHAWPGAVIAGVALLQQSRTAAPRLLIAAWMLSTLFAHPLVALPNLCLVGPTIQAELRTDRARCSGSPSTWDVSDETFESALGVIRAKDPAQSESDARGRVERTLSDYFRLWCRDVDAELKISTP